MRISDWSSDVCSSDLPDGGGRRRHVRRSDPALRADRSGGDDMKRTHLPLNALRVLDAAARHLSFTRAADELAVTTAAVGQQVRALAATPWIMLFRRPTTGLDMTHEAARGLPAGAAGVPP